MALQTYNKQMENLQLYLQRFCALAEAFDLARFEEDFNRKRTNTSQVLKDISVESHWGIHRPLLAAAEQVKYTTKKKREKRY